jgi:hypothetical protein
MTSVLSKAIAMYDGVYVNELTDYFICSSEDCFDLMDETGSIVYNMSKYFYGWDLTDNGVFDGSPEITLSSFNGVEKDIVMRRTRYLRLPTGKYIRLKKMTYKDGIYLYAKQNKFMDLNILIGDKVVAIAREFMRSELYKNNDKHWSSLRLGSKYGEGSSIKTQIYGKENDKRMLVEVVDEEYGGGRYGVEIGKLVYGVDGTIESIDTSTNMDLKTVIIGPDTCWQNIKKYRFKNLKAKEE